MSEWRPIETAPKDGSYIVVRDDEGNGCCAMRWDVGFVNHLVGSEPGLWVSRNDDFTWCDRDGFGPTLWMPEKLN